MKIDRVSTLTQKEFKHNYLEPGLPVIITEAIKDWPATKNWSPDFFKTKYGDCDIQIQVLEREIASNTEIWLKELQHEKMTIRKYLDQIDKYGKEIGGRRYAAQWPLALINKSLKDDIGKLDIYPENWEKLREGLRKSRLFGFTPLLWIGPAGCVTGLHYDIFENFFFQFYGKKNWTIFPASQNESLYLPSYLRQPHHSPVDCENPDLHRFPKFKNTTPITFTTNPGEMLYLPGHWAHHVRTIEYSISVNMWWVTSFRNFLFITSSYLWSQFRRKKKLPIVT